MKKENQNENKKEKRFLPCDFSTDFVISPKILAANPSMQGQPTGIQPKPGMAKSRSVGRTRLLGGSALGSGTRMTLTPAGSIVRSSDGVARVQNLQANVPLYGMACGGGLAIPSPEKRDTFSSSCHEVWTQNSDSGLLAAAESVVAPKP